MYREGLWIPPIIEDVKIVRRDRQAIFIQPKELAHKFTHKHRQQEAPIEGKVLQV